MHDYKIRLARGSTASRLEYIPTKGELILDNEAMKLYVGDGVTPGGHEILYGGKLLDVIDNGGLRVATDKHHRKITIEDFKELI